MYRSPPWVFYLKPLASCALQPFPVFACRSGFPGGLMESQILALPAAQLCPIHAASPLADALPDSPLPDAIPAAGLCRNQLSAAARLLLVRTGRACGANAEAILSARTACPDLCPWFHRSQDQ